MSETLELAAQAVVRGEEQYGKAEDSFDTIAWMWNGYLRARGFEVSITGRDVAVLMVLFKVSRIAEGYYDEDNWVDICGYACIGGDME